ncbi:M23 family metallopeptidase [Thermomonospora amylolytica]|uniref:M23 family metallopeptidase n=1 Tax=Thermomonospora amylolytica TaxID=1411117 RepID=UPI0013001771|nr:M23 family metallopeptidase [Thermomonospora amylolytica]
MARRPPPDPSDPFREFWEHPGRSSRRSGRRPGARRTDSRHAGARHGRHARPDAAPPRARVRTAARPGDLRRRPVDGLRAGSLVVTFAVGVALLAVVENALINGGVTGLSGTGATGAQATAPQGRAREVRRPRDRTSEPERTLDDRVRELTLRLRGPIARRSYGGDRPPLHGAIRFSRDRAWAFGTTAIPVPEDRAAMPQVALYIAEWTGQTWRIALSGTEEFDALLTRVPAEMMPADERRTLARFSAGTARPDQARGLMLPWRAGQSWFMTAAAADGPAARPLGALAFRGGDGRVLAAGPGRLYRFCADRPGRGMVLVIHPDGLASTYYHLTDVTDVRDGGLVERGAPLGRIGTDRPCGGAPVDRAQVRFGLRTGNEDLPIDGLPIGGWIFRERARPLIGWAERGLLQVLPGTPLRNFGPDAPDDPAPGRSPRPDGSPDLPDLPEVPGLPDPPGRPGDDQERNANADP